MLQKICIIIKTISKGRSIPTNVQNTAFKPILYLPTIFRHNVNKSVTSGDIAIKYCFKVPI